ncbi:GNAT family N-acetyltransferase [Nocardioides aurantiacus]|uniref:Ribosomal protein S18 acetylase RimI-like enzyme n=1 Tax=Nocardioides aurantiacus TaxID=86796 RepID=A0A3N2CQH9_9ACTN|nr:GNAT family N-acetyltransferase [Nocardioides aurantiacus]ROR89790.1 ribosomal protein S18 acetylase RimI-like enzyme [Nocardioides aurantiacus]
MSAAEAVTLRPRRPEDVPRLAELLAAQQPTSHYPLRWPLPFPVEDFLVRPGEQAAWVAERDGVLLGHVALTDPGDLADRFAAALPGRRRDDLAAVSVLVVAPASRGLGIGGLLLDTAVAHARAAGWLPVLDVVPTHVGAVSLYRGRGWREVGSFRPPWLAEERPALLLMVLDP